MGLDQKQSPVMSAGAQSYGSHGRVCRREWKRRTEREFDRKEQAWCGFLFGERGRLHPAAGLGAPSEGTSYQRGNGGIEILQVECICFQYHHLRLAMSIHFILAYHLVPSLLQKNSEPVIITKLLKLAKQRSLSRRGMQDERKLVALT